VVNAFSIIASLGALAPRLKSIFQSARIGRIKMLIIVIKKNLAIVTVLKTNQTVFLQNKLNKPL
jgi:hypothetical protein